MPIAVSNSSPLIHLSMIGRTGLLRRFSSICIPPAVWREVVELGGSRPGATEIHDARKSGWLRVAEPSDKALVHLLEQELHATGTVNSSLSGKSPICHEAKQRVSPLLLRSGPMCSFLMKLRLAA